MDFSNGIFAVALSSITTALQCSNKAQHLFNTVKKHKFYIYIFFTVIFLMYCAFYIILYCNMLKKFKGKKIFAYNFACLGCNGQFTSNETN